MTQDLALAQNVRLALRIQADLAEYILDPEAVSERVAPPDAEANDVLPPESTLLDLFDERITDPDLRAATRSRFVSTHYADAVESAVKCLNECVRTRSGRVEDGDALMTIVFSQNKPLLRINPMRTKSDESAQRGHMQLCQGVVGAWRNPRAHSLLDDEPQRALMMMETINELIAVTKSATRTRQRKSAVTT